MNSLYMIGNTHFDPAWLWTWDEAMASIRATFRSALDRMKEDEDFIYSFSTPAVFEWIEQTDPELFAEIQQRVREGRWDIEAEGWWLQPDCNIPSGESLVRQGLYGQTYLQERFGKRATTVFNIDSFGHSAMMPQILKKCGLDYYVFSRPSDGEMKLEDNLFTWKAADGSTVTAYRGGSEGYGSYPQDTAESIRNQHDALVAAKHDMLAVYGVSDHGGAPTKQSIADIHEMQRTLKDVDICFASTTDFFCAQQGKVTSTFCGELQPRFYGPFSLHTEVKGNNRRGEYSLDRAEKVSFLSDWLVGREYPAAQIRQGWKDLMFNQFHDILGGTCIPDVFVDARDLHGRLIQNANETTHFALQSIVRRIKTVGNNVDSVWNLCVFNPSAQPYRGVIEGEVQWAWEFPWYEGGVEVFDENGKVYKAQIITEKSQIPGFRSRFAFEAEVPAMGYRTFAVRKTEEKIERDYSETSVESPFVFRVFEDAGDVWCFNTTQGYGAACELPELTERRTVENGPLLKRVKQVWRFGNSIFEEYITVYAESDVVDYRYRVHWNEKHKVLKLIPVKEEAMTDVTAAVPGGSLVRPADGREYPVGEWLRWGEGETGTTLLLQGVYAYNTDRMPQLTLVRSPIFGDLRVRELDYNIDYQYLEQGVHTGSIRIVPKALTAGRASVLSAQWNAQTLTVCEANHDGDLPPVCSGLSVDADNVVVTALKQAEDENGYVLRLNECDGKAGKVNLRLGDWTASVCIAPHEIKTIRFLKNGEVREANMLEEIL